MLIKGLQVLIMAISIYIHYIIYKLDIISYINLFFLFYRSLNFAINKSGNYKKQRNKHKID